MPASSPCSILPQGFIKPERPLGPAPPHAAQAGPLDTCGDLGRIFVSVWKCFLQPWILGLQTQVTLGLFPLTDFYHFCTHL